MRPGPTIPISTIEPPGPLLPPGAGRRHSAFNRSAQAKVTQHGETARCERLEVAQGLRLLEDREAVRLPRDRHVAGIVLDDLQEQAGLRSALVQLPGRVQESRSVTRGGRKPHAIPHRRPDRRQRGFRCRRARVAMIKYAGASLAMRFEAGALRRGTETAGGSLPVAQTRGPSSCCPSTPERWAGRRDRCPGWNCDRDRHLQRRNSPPIKQPRSVSVTTGCLLSSSAHRAVTASDSILMYTNTLSSP
jgi:hypothetical protein